MIAKVGDPVVAAVISCIATFPLIATNVEIIRFMSAALADLRVLLFEPTLLYLAQADPGLPVLGSDVRDRGEGRGE